jgi:hypothetical protein
LGKYILYFLNQHYLVVALRGRENFLLPQKRIQFLSNFALREVVGTRPLVLPIVTNTNNWRCNTAWKWMKIDCTQHSRKVLLLDWIWKSTTSTLKAYRSQKAIIWVVWCVRFDIVAIQETHTTSDLNLLNRGKLPGFKLIGAIQIMKALHCLKML